MKAYLEKSDILLPDFKKTDGGKWAVIACDQFTSESEYWKSAEATVGTSPSALNLVLPEIYLEDNRDERVAKINAYMKKYLESVLVSHNDTMIYLERIDSQGKKRLGIIGKIDLEDYDYSKKASSLIRATEGTVLERIPPRVEVRRNAEIELPHVMLLIDDIEKTVIEPLAEKKKEFEPAYSFNLMLGGGSVSAYFIDEKTISDVQSALSRLAGDEENPLLFAVGDGNHSLATAKAHYEALKEKLGDEAKSHIARYALVEVTNIHDSSLEFEPIYRVMFNVEPKKVLEELSAYAKTLKGSASKQVIECYYKGEKQILEIEKPELQLTVATLQKFIDEYLAKNKGASVDYIHGENSVKELALQDNAIGFIFDGMGKSDLFKTVIYDGALPRKTFSMGHAEDKRYYIECRKIK
jgi:hypothetical protein